MITIGELVARDDLAVSILAGGSGGQRIVTWAHAVDLPDPWNWVRPGDLVMITGAGLPATGVEQAAWIAQLADANISGLVFAPPPDAPALTLEALRVAEQRHVPVLRTSFDLEFAQVARIVIESALDSQRHRLAKSERLFSAYAHALREGGSLRDRMGVIERRFGWELTIEMGEPPAAPDATSHGEAGLGPFEMVIPGRTAATLLVRQRDPSRVADIVDPLVVHYLSGLLGVELEREAIDRDHDRKTGAELLELGLEGRLDFATVRAGLDRRGFGARFVSVALRPAGAAAWQMDSVHHLPAFGAVKPLIGLVDAGLIALLPDDDDVIEQLRSAIGLETRVGVSAPVNVATGLLESFHQARLALEQAIDITVPRVTYSASRPVSLLPETVAEASALARRYLDPILDHDAAYGTELVATISTFLMADGNWKKTAEQLCIHRQTLVYRLKTVEQLTGLKPTSTLGTASLWLAIKAGQSVGIVPDDRW